MTEKEQLIRARFGILALAAEMKNVGRACKVAGISRSQFYAMKKAYETYGKEGLLPKVRRKPAMPNRTSAQLETQILLQTRENPSASYIRLAAAMKSEGIRVAPTTIRYVWQRYGLSTRLARLDWVMESKDRLKGGKSGDGQNGLDKTTPSAPLIPNAISSRDSATGRKSFAGKDLGVDWSYWSQRVRESLTK